MDKPVCLCGNPNTRQVDFLTVCDQCGDWWPTITEMADDQPDEDVVNDPECYERPLL